MSGLKRILCLGNPYIETDRAGPLVFEHLTAQRLPDSLEIVDGGLAGLDLLRFFAGCQALVLVDSLLEQPLVPGGLVLLSRQEAAELATETFGHGAGLPYLLKMLPAALEETIPEVTVLGLQPPFSRTRIEAAVRCCFELLAVQPAAIPEGERISGR